MHFIIGFVLSFMALFPASDGGGKSLYQLWMESYEKYLYAQMAENFERERNEQAASEESVLGHNLCGETCEGTTESGSEVATERTDEGLPTVAATETIPLQEDVPTEQVVLTTPLYMVDGYVPDENLQTYLYTQLCNSGIGYFFPYAVCLIAQESTWNPMARNANGEDFGLLQYKLRFVPWMDWTNPYQQIDYFVAQMANRSARGLTVSQMISCHMMSDYGEYNQSYVDAVMSHSNTLVQIR